MTSIEKLQNNVNQVNSDFNAIKDKIVECGVEVADGTPTYQLRNKVTEVYNKGKQDEYDAFWDRHQKNADGTMRTNYSFGFAGMGWNSKESFRPKYSMQPKRSDWMFASMGSNIGDLVEYLKEIGVMIDLSASENFQNMFNWSGLTRVGLIDARADKNGLKNIFYYSKVVTIDELILKEDGSNTFAAAFEGASALENIKTSGVIGQNIDFKSCTKLSKASITNIMEHLSTTASGKTATFSKTAVNKEFETASGANDGSTSAEWVALKNTRTNWTISLA